MTEAERSLVRLAELASFAPDDAEDLLSVVTGQLTSMAREGRLGDVDRVLAAMRPSTSRLIVLALLSDHGSADLGHEGTPSLTDLLARMERNYLALQAREEAADPEAREVSRRIGEIAQEAVQGPANRRRDDAYLSRMHERRSRGH